MPTAEELRGIDLLLLRCISPRFRHHSVRPNCGVELTAARRVRIIDVLNQPYNDSTDYGWKRFTALPRMLAVTISESLDMRYVSNAPVLLTVWEKLSTYSLFRKLATHAAHFWVDAATALRSSIALAHFLSSFCARYFGRESCCLRDSKIVQLGFHIDRYGVVGTTLFHSGTVYPTRTHLRNVVFPPGM
ncbi:hypothetical protein BV22DRAFT_159700 [Leucogyrophana mollusca]|uniref:Uncharacterized protein n=1 Tax=Leucogyrophana mollusca TaxID=85980 RepID=A0ACB8BSR1_9AGAM|nr:hypothetical protein BV22DRAFT_159700 [Leucogyrophana mollusca]